MSILNNVGMGTYDFWYHPHVSEALLLVAPELCNGRLLRGFDE